MATYSKILLSGSTNGKPVKVAATATIGTTIHTAVSGTSDLDEVWLWGFNIGTDDITLTIEFGDATSTIIVDVPYKSGLIPIIPGFVVNNSVVVTAFASTADKVFLAGFVNRIVA